MADIKLVREHNSPWFLRQKNLLLFLLPIIMEEKVKPKGKKHYYNDTYRIYTAIFMNP